MVNKKLWVQSVSQDSTYYAERQKCPIITYKQPTQSLNNFEKLMVVFMLVDV